MTGTGTPKKPHLSVVKDAQGGGRARVLSLEKLSPEQAERVRLYHQVINPSGVLVGIVQGQSDWDLRPLLLSKGVITISRFVSPQLQKQLSGVIEFQSYLSRVAPLADREIGMLSQSQGELFWITRRYFNTVVGEGTARPSDALRLLSSLLAALESLHTQGLVHGHVAPSNLVIEGPKLLLLDHGFHLFDPQENSNLPDLAPEVAETGVHAALPPSVDLYGVGVVMKAILSDYDRGRFANLIEALTTLEGPRRPTLSQVRDIISTGAQSVAGKSTEPSVPAPKVIQVPPQPAPQEERKKLPISEPSSPSRTVTLPITPRMVQRALMVGLILGGLWIGRGLYQRFFPSRATSELSGGTYETWWKSSQPSLMQQVAKAALKGDEDAYGTILRSLTAGDKHPLVQYQLVLRAFNPLWEGNLTEKDRIAVLRLALSALIPSEERTMVPLNELHPGVVLAIMSEMVIDPANPQLLGEPLDRYGSLPLPFGPPYAALSRIGITSLGDPTAQALGHILFQDLSDSVVRAFFPEMDPVPLSLAKLDVMIPLFDVTPGLEDVVFGSLFERAEGSGRIFGWFAKDQLVGWSAVSKREKILLVAGVFPERQLSRDQLADLLRFPRLNVRDKAKSLLAAEESVRTLGPVLDILAGNESKFTRAQTISLLAAFQVRSEADYGFIAQWFDTQPHPGTVLAVLLARSGAPDTDPFNIEGSRYLASRSDWTAAPEQIEGLITHSEPLARALGYARLRISVPVERAILAKAAAEEPNPRMKAQLEARLAD